MLRDNSLLMFGYLAVAGTLAAYIGGHIGDFILDKLGRKNED